MKVVVITGSTRGIGFGLAEAFLARGCAVVVNGRRAAGVEEAVAKLSAKFDSARVLGHAADVSDAEQVAALWEHAIERFGRVDVWVNNAGLENQQSKFWELESATVRAVVAANLLGSMYGCKVAIAGMLAQDGGGQIYNMEGMGSDGRAVPGLAPYASSKYALSYFTKQLVDELKDTPVRIGLINPGMVVTDMLLNSVAPERRDNARRVFSILADTVDDVAAWLADAILAEPRHGAKLAWLTTPKIIGRFLLSPFQKRNVLDGYDF